MNKTVKLKDRTEVLIRPLTRDDLETSLAFFKALPEEDRMFLRRNVTQRPVVEERIREVEQGSAKRLVAISAGSIVADATIELSEHDWEDHVAELRLVVARPFQRKGLGMLLARELFRIATSAGVEEIVVRMMRPQTAAQNIFHKLGFREELLLPGFAKDREGTKRDLILMRCNLKELWRQLHDHQSEWDMRGGRA